MRFKEIHHCTLVVAALDEAASFYRDVLGLDEIESPETFGPAGLDARWFRVGTQQLHLLAAEEPFVPSRRHVALHVDDARAARSELASKGIDMRETVPIPGADRFFVTDPAGNRVEIIEWHREK